MSIKIIITSFFAVILISACLSCGKNKVENKNIYTAYYFHPTARCESCLNLEAFLKELIETKYSKEGFEFKEMNIEQKENEHFKKDYDLKFSSVIILNKENNKWKNLDSVWSFTDNKEKFFNYTSKEIELFINNK